MSALGEWYKPLMLMGNQNSYLKGIHQRGGSCSAISWKGKDLEVGTGRQRCLHVGNWATVILKGELGARDRVCANY